MKLKDTKTKRFEIRMTEEEYKLLTITAEYVGRNPTEFVRLLLNGAFTEMRDIIDKGVNDYENVTSVLDDQLQHR